MNAQRNVIRTKTILFLISLLLFISNTCVLGKSPAEIKNFYAPVEIAGDANVPVNDLCAYAIEVQAGVPYSGSTIHATGDRTSSCGSSDNLDVWYLFIPTQSGMASFSLSGSNFDTTLAIYEQCGGTELACNDDANGTRQSEIIMFVDANVSYLIRIAGYSQSSGDYILTVDSIVAPENDDCANAIEVQEGMPYLGSTLGASSDGNSSCNDSDDLDVWHIFSPDQSGSTTISLMGSSFDTTLAI